MTDPAVPDGHTLDAFHRGAYHLVQPARAGHRAGMDAMMLAAAVPPSFSGRLADLGAGAGAAGLAVAARCPASRVVLFERAPEMLASAQATLSHPLNAAFSGRVSLRAADVTAAGRAREAAGLDRDGFDFAIMNPPFNFGRDRATPDALKRDAHVMEADLFQHWLKTAAAIVKPRGGVALIARPQSVAAILAALAGRFGAARLMPIHAHADRPAIRIVVRAVRASRADLEFAPALVLHEQGSDRFSAAADAINNGRASLFGD